MMKRRMWVCFLASLLLLTVIATGTHAEEGTLFIESAEDFAPEEVEGELGEDDFTSEGDNDGEEYALSAPDGVEEVVVEPEHTTDPAQPAMTGTEDFKIVNGILVKYNGAGGDVIIPDGVTAIGDLAFYECADLMGVTIPSGVTSIGDSAFALCHRLTRLTIPDSVTSIGTMAFYYCNSLTSVTIPYGVTIIEGCAFEECTGLTSVTIPGSVTSIGELAFSECTGLTIVTIPDSVTRIGWAAFRGCTGLTRVSIGKSVKTICGGAFERCYNLASVTIPSSVIIIDEDAFSKCYSLTDVTIDSSKNPEEKISIDDNAFSGCSATLPFHTCCETPATKYAEANGFPVVKTDHEIETVPGREPTCTETGLTEGMVCAYCGEVFQAQQTIPATGHTPVTLLAVPATATKTGLTEGKKCSVCGEILVAQKVVPKVEFHMKKNATKKAAVGDSFQIVVDGQKIKSCKSDNKKVAAVSKAGVATAKGEGTAKITVTPTKGKALTLTVKVTDPNAPKAIAISVDGKSAKKATVRKGKALQLTALVTRPANGKATFTWMTSDRKIATVDKKGKVKGVRPGTVTIIATTQNGVKKTIKITVKK